MAEWVFETGLVWLVETEPFFFFLRTKLWECQSTLRHNERKEG